jgi:hypothetical protein
MEHANDFSFRRAVSQARARDYAPSPPIIPHSDAFSPSPPTPSFRLATTLIPIYTSALSSTLSSQPTSTSDSLPLITSLKPVSIAPFASIYFPQATNPLWVPSADDLPKAWQPHFGQDETMQWVRFMVVIVGLFALCVVGIVGASLMK